MAIDKKHYQRPTSELNILLLQSNSPVGIKCLKCERSIPLPPGASLLVGRFANGKSR